MSVSHLWSSVKKKMMVAVSSSGVSDRAPLIGQKRARITTKKQEPPTTRQKARRAIYIASLRKKVPKKVDDDTSYVEIYYSGILDVPQEKSRSIRVYERVASVPLKEEDGSS
jgi:hypothetical protein